LWGVIIANSYQPISAACYIFVTRAEYEARSAGSESANNPLTMRYYDGRDGRI
jgi:hypothetical protein